MMRRMRVAFFGLPLGALLLEADGHTIELAVLSPFEAPGRRRLLGRLGRERVLEAAGLEQVEERLRETDLVVSWFWSRKLPERWLARGRLGAIGVHPSLLPRHRGPNPYFWAIDSGDAETGVSVHRLSAEYDQGDVLHAVAMGVGDRDAWQLARALDRPSLRALRDVVAAFARGEPPRGAPQDESLVTWAPEPEGELLRVDWSWPTERVLRRIRALSPVPGVALELCGRDVFVTRAAPATSWPGALAPGEAAALGDPPVDVVIRTGDGAVRVVRAVFADEEALPTPPSTLAQLVASRTRAV